MSFECFVALGGNLPGSFEAIQSAVNLLRERVKSEIRVSEVYQTTPVSPIAQPSYWNAACCFWTNMKIKDLWKEIQDIEKRIGKQKKTKDAPRLIDLDLLFYGNFVGQEENLEIPHPRWQERLFVLAPLRDLTHHLPIGMSIEEAFKRFKNPHQEKVERIEGFVIR